MAIIKTGSQIPAKPLFFQNFAQSKSLDSKIYFGRSSTATYVDYDGIIKTAPAGVPRFDHDPMTGECYGLLNEQDATNKIAYSNLNAGWSNQFVSISANTLDTLDPMGTNTAAKVLESSTIQYAHRVYLNWATGFGTGGRERYMFSCFVKNIATNPSDHAITLELYNGLDSTSSCRFDLINGEIINGGPAVGQAFMHQYPNGWWRIGLTTMMAPSRDYWGPYIFSSRTNVRDPAGITATETGFYIWGAQFENRSGVSSVIPTNGAAVTRSADNCYLQQSVVTLPQSEGFSGYWRTRKTANIANVQYYEHPVSIGLHNMFTDPYGDDLYHFDPGQQNMGSQYTYYQVNNRYTRPHWLSYAFSLQYGGALWGAWEQDVNQSYSNFNNSGHSYTSTMTAPTIGLSGRHAGSNRGTSQHISEVGVWGYILDENQLKNLAWEND